MASREGEVDLDLGSWHLSEEEATPIIIAAPTSEGPDRMRSLCLMGKILIDRKHDIRSMRGALKQSWGCNFTMVRVRANIIQIIFDYQQDAERVLLNGPWCYSNSLICLKRWVENWETTSDFFSSSDFWVHIVDMPYHVYTETIGKKFAKALNVKGAWQLRTEQPSGRRLFRMRIPVDLRRSLRRFASLIINGVPLLAKLQYERLPYLCGQCGKWNHTVGACPDVGRELNEAERLLLPYGEKQELNVARRSTLLMEVRPVSFPESQGTRTTLNASVIEQSVPRPLPIVEGDDIQGWRNCDPPVLDNIMQQFMNPIVGSFNSTGLSKKYRGNLISWSVHCGSNGQHIHELSKAIKSTVSECFEVKGELTEAQRRNLPNGEGMEIKANRKSTLFKEVRTERLSESLESPNMGNPLGNPVTSVATRIEARPHDEEQVIGQGSRSNEQPVPVTQIIVNVPSSLAPMFSNLMSRAINHSGRLESAVKGHITCTPNIERSKGTSTWLRRTRVLGLGEDDYVNNRVDDYLHNSEHGARNGDVLMHYGTREQVDMDRKRKIEDDVDGESSMKKTRLTISEPLVEPAELQAHPAL